MILIGELSLWVALLMAAWGVITSIAGAALRRPELVMSGERAVLAMWVLLVAASAGLTTALLTHDFSFRYVTQHTSANLPTLYTFSAFWAGRSGTLLVSGLLLSSCASLAVSANRNRRPELMPYATATFAALLLMLLSAMCFGANPYERLDWMSPDGIGLDPLWQHPLMAVYPPFMYLGYACAAVPFAFAIAALATRRLERGWMVSIRRWALASWAFVAIGILFGMRWAYEEPAWNVLWEWHAAMNGSLLAWLINTVFLQLSRTDEKRGSIRKWNVTLVISAFLLVVLAGVIQFGGVMSTIRSFGQSGNAVPVYALLTVAYCVAVYLVARRLVDVDAQARDDNENPVQPHEGTSGAVGGRTRRRAGGYVVLLGIAAILIGFVGVGFRTAYTSALKPGETVAHRDPFGATWKLTSQGISRFAALNRTVTAVALQTARDDAPKGLIISEHRQHADSRGVPTFEPSREAGIARSWKQDLYVVLESVEEDETATLLIAFNPLAGLIWIGGALVTFGGVFLFWPAARQDA